MSVRLQVSVHAAADPATVWAEMTDWPGQSRWIPLTTVRVDRGPAAGVGGHVTALSGFWLGPVPVGLLDRFVVTGWTPPEGDEPGELEVLHLGPYFTGEGAFRVTAENGGTRITATELFAVPGGRPVERVVRLLLPVMRRGFEASLQTLRRIAESSDRGRAGR